MRFRIRTLVDITHTRIRRRHDKESAQQDNYDTVAQTIGLRVNPENINVYSKHEEAAGLGSRYQGEQQVWYFDFTPNIEDAITLDMLIDDFNLIPFITELDETVEFTENYFLTKDRKTTNISFEQIE
jgi:hypothetical protein